MDIKQFLSNKQNQYLLGGIAVLGIGYYLYKKGKLPFLNKLVGGGKTHKIGYLTQGKFKGEDRPEAVALHLATPRPKESEIAPNGQSVTTNDFVYIKGTDFDGKYQVGAKWTDADGNLGAIWIGVKKQLGEQYPAKIYKYENKGTLRLSNK